MSCKTPCKIPCCIVDDHCDIVPFLYSCWRSKIIPFRELFLLHIDSHPDLGIPCVSDIADFQKLDNLVDILETEDGINEFILPLVCNGHFDQICWVHPKFLMDSNGVGFKFDSGSGTRFNVGNTKNGGTCVTLQESYYFDDGLVYSSSEVSSSISVNLLVCDSDATLLPSFSTPQGASPDVPWILDICLDYFSVSNPFLVRLRQALSLLDHTTSKPIPSDRMPSDVAEHIILQTLRLVAFRQPVQPNTKESTTELRLRREARQNFLLTLSELCDAAVSANREPCIDDGTLSRVIGLVEALSNQQPDLNHDNPSVPCVGKSSVGTREVDNDTCSGGGGSGGSGDGGRDSELTEAFLSHFHHRPEAVSWARLLLQLLPALPASALALLHTDPFLLLLPHHIAGSTAVKGTGKEGESGDAEAVISQAVREVIAMLVRSGLSPPVAVTIARSVGGEEEEGERGCTGEYTPRAHADIAQRLVLSGLQDWLHGRYSYEAPTDPPIGGLLVSTHVPAETAGGGGGEGCMPRGGVSKHARSLSEEYSAERRKRSRNSLSPSDSSQPLYRFTRCDVEQPLLVHAKSCAPSNRELGPVLVVHDLSRVDDVREAAYSIFSKRP